MKTKAIAISTGNIIDPVLEKMMQIKDTELKDQARKNAKHFAKRNLPALDGDSIANYIGEIKAGYEKLAADVFHYLQPAAHFPEAKTDADYFREKDQNLEAEINKKESQNHNDQYEIHDFNPNSIPLRVLFAVLATLIITVGEILFNTKALQVTAESMLFALILSICISFAVFFASHIAPLMYKVAKNKLQRLLVISVSLIFVIGLFIGLAILRSDYLAAHNVHINPFFFVIINLFFFIVSTLLSFFIMPLWSEIKQNLIQLKLYYAIKKRNKEIERLKKEREQIRAIIMERTKLSIRIAHHANYAADRIRKMYWEAVGIFKTTNLTFRSDGTPDCFQEILPDPDINDFNYTVIISNTEKL